MKAKSIKGQSNEEIKSALEKATSNGFKPTLAFAFITNLEDIDALSAILDAAGISIFGASTAEKFNEEGIDPSGIIIMLLDMNPANFKIVLEVFNVSSVYESACAVGEAGKKCFEHPAFIISTADIRIPGGDVIRGILDFTNQAKSDSGILALIVDEDKVEVKGVAVSGWKPVGTEKRITKCEGNWVYTIDGEPALDVIKKFLGKDIILNNKAEGIDSFPLQVQRVKGKPMMRPIVQWNEEEKSIMLGAAAEEGSLFRFSLPPDYEVIDAVIESAKTIKENELPEADAMVVFSCVGRLSQLGPMLSAELDGLAATWNKPMAGFFSLGEYGKLDDTRPEFHGTTVSWVALKEL